MRDGIIGYPHIVGFPVLNNGRGETEGKKKCHVHKRVPLRLFGIPVAKPGRRGLGYIKKCGFKLIDFLSGFPVSKYIWGL